MRRTWAVSVAVCALVAAAPVLPPAHGDGEAHRVTSDPTGDDAAPGVYVVVLDEPPLATYDGTVPAYPATAPQGGVRFDASRAVVEAYRTHVLMGQQEVLDSLGNPPVLYHYTTALNGFAADLASEQVKALRTMPEVLTVQHSDTLRLASLPRPGRTDRVGPVGRDRTWRKLGPAREAGDGVVIGVIDSGLWPENPSFDGVPLDERARRSTYPGFTGVCESGERWSADLCDAKVLSARFFVNGFGTDQLAAGEFVSPRDATGHGSHVAGVAAGNAGVAVTIDGQSFGRISGVAPAAALAVYKACWTAPNPQDDGCTVADTVAAVDRAVSDGVDVLNYSISGAGADDVVAQAFLNAASAGVFVAAAAGDEGPTAGTVDHTSPWVTAVAASTERLYRGRVWLGDGASIAGTMASSDDVVEAPLVYAGDVPPAGAEAADAALCLPGALDADALAGAVVLCDRGVNSRIDKGRSALRAGAVAMVLANTGPGDLPADVHALPAVHVSAADRERILVYIDSADQPVAGLESVGATSAVTPRAARFSSRGPATDTSADVLKPDITAPGVSVLSAVAPTSGLSRSWDLMSGTSMSAPYVAGLAALLIDRHSTWSPAAVKSALMTTAAPVSGGRPLVAGAGLARLSPALDPGLVYDTDPDDWLRYFAGELTGRQLNQPSIAVGELVGAETVHRTVTNVGRRTETFTADMTGLRGLSVAVTPSTIRIAPGASADVELAFNAKRTARYGEFARGALTWTGSRGHAVTSPVVVRPEFLAAPSNVTASVADASTVFRARAGVTGRLRIRVVGPVAADPEPFTLEPGDFDPSTPTIDSSTMMRLFLVPDGTSVARFQVDAATALDDLDLYVFHDHRLVATAVNGAADEQITLENPEPGLYTVYLNSASSAFGDATTSGSFVGWVLGAETSRRLRVTPDPVTVTGGRPFGLRASWAGLDDRRAWFGYVEYGGSNTRTYLTLR